MSRDDITLAIVRLDGAIINDGRIACIIAEGHGRSNRDVPLTLTHAESCQVFVLLKAILEKKAKKAA